MYFPSLICPLSTLPGLGSWFVDGDFSHPSRAGACRSGTAASDALSDRGRGPVGGGAECAGASVAPSVRPRGGRGAPVGPCAAGSGSECAGNHGAAGVGKEVPPLPGAR